MLNGETVRGEHVVDPVCVPYDVFENIPEELKAPPQWVVWKYEDHGKPKRDKVLYNPRTEQRAKSNDSQTWTSFAEALAAFRRGGFDGVGFVFSAADPYAGIDLDSCRDPATGRLEPWAGEIVERLDSYTEASPSGRGVHILVKAVLPAGGRKKDKVEMYDSGRFFTISGEHIGGTPATIKERTAELAALHAEVFGKQQEKSQERAHTGDGSANGHTNPLTDGEIILLAKRAKNGELFARLYAGDTTGYPSQSEADQAFCNLLAFYCGPDPARIDQLFRQSGLYRQKWDQKHFGDGRTYGEATIEKALTGTREFYSGVGSNGTKTYARYQGGDEDFSGSWPEPGEIPGGLLLVPPMADVMIPEPLRPWLTDIAERIQCPLSFPTVGAIVVIAALVGRLVSIRPKKYDDWHVIPNLWGGIIGRPGIMKSPALAEVMKPLFRLELQAQIEHGEAVKKFEFSKLVAKAKRDDLERKLKEAIKKGQDPESIMANSSLTEEEEPVLRRFKVNDSTVEKLGVILNQNPRGVLLFRDELTGWLRTLDREGHENDRSFYLEAWNGNGAYTYDRIGRGTLHIKAACVSILGGIQPGPLADYLRATIRGGAGDDGLTQRFQLLVYPDDPGQWRNVDRWPDTAAKNRAFVLFEKLDVLDPLAIGAVSAEGEEVPSLHFSPDGQGLFDDWRADLEQKIRSRDEHPALEAHLAKYRSLMPSLALLFHLLEIVDGTAEGAVSQHAAAMAAAWCDFLEAHARRIYQGVTQHALFSARQLAERIKAGKLNSPFTLRQVYNNGWSGLSTPEDAERAVEILEDLNWLRSEKLSSGRQGGRPSWQYHINPCLRQGEE